MNLLWAPGMSESAREICRNLSGWEKAAAYTLSLLFGLCVFAIGAVFMGSVLAMEPFRGLVEGFAIPSAMILLAAVLLINVQQRRLLVNSRFARDKGIRRADIETRHIPSRSDYLVLARFAGLAVAISLGAVLVAS